MNEEEFVRRSAYFLSHTQCAFCLTFVLESSTSWMAMTSQDGNLRSYRFCEDCASFFKKNPPKRRAKHNWKQDGF